MQSYLKTRSVGVQLMLFLGMAFGIFIIFSLFAALILSNITGISLLEFSDVAHWNYNNPSLITFLRGMLLAQFFGLYVVPCSLFAYFSDPKPFEYLGFQKPWKEQYWLLGIVVMLVSMPLVDYLGLVNRQINFGASLKGWIEAKEQEAMKQILFMVRQHSISELVYNLIFISLFAGIGEELFFRGILQRLFIRAFKSPWLGIIFTALLFSAFHFQFYGFFPRMFLGVLLGALYWYSGSLWTAMLAHFLYDGSLIVLAYLHPEMLEKADATLFSESGLLFKALLSAVLVALVLWLMKRNSKSSYAEVYQNDHPSAEDFTF